MEAPLAKCLEEVVDSGAVGVICADRHGLALHSSGPVQLKSAGVIATLASLAKEIDPSCDTTPTIHLESDSLDIMIQQKELVTVGVYSAAKK
ncbi:ragulator complex protein LAMTOR5 homolog [Dermacentor andersoni]|uniref:ragulator complex protein LAMTOR5 homolog n=1 Tax=Dermacentor andersoni TaxID=34620 RepID=UPI00215550F9|nr:ragulator complex protein LAMTOR5 homolog [Dermacentor andersoni]